MKEAKAWQLLAYVVGLSVLYVGIMWLFISREVDQSRKERTLVKLGSKVKDVISGYEGIAIARTEYLNGCVQVCVEGSHKDGERVQVWSDEQRIQVIEQDVFKPEPTTATAGGPGPLPPRY